MLPIVSICVPIYNVENYIERCAVSLLGQTYGKIEYVFVNDCSPDKSVEVLRKVMEDYPEKKDYVKIINHEKNRGLAAARNTAVNHSEGDFILHVDSDDYLGIDAVEKLVNKQQETEADIVTGQAVQIEKGKLSVMQRPQFLCKDDFVKDMIMPSISHTIWGRLIRKSLYTDYGIEAKEGVNIGEDLQAMSKLAYFAQKVETIWDVVYYYDCTNELSYMNQFDTASIRRLVQDTTSMEIVRDFFVGKSDKFQNQAEGYLRDYYLKLLRYYGRSKMKEDFEKIQERLFGLRPQNRKMPKQQEMKFGSYRMFRLVDSILK